jgi:hypothetical protein
MKKVFLYIWTKFVTFISFCLMYPDRFIQAFDPRLDIPSMQAINELNFEKDRLVRRWVIYIFVTAFAVLFEWLFGMLSFVLTGLLWFWNLIF